MTPKPDRLVALVADDLPDSRENLSDILTYLAPDRIGISFDVTTVGNLEDFTKVIVEDGLRPDLILLDNSFEFAGGMDAPNDETLLNQGLTVFAPRINTWRRHGNLPQHCAVCLVTAGDWRRSPDRPHWLDIGLLAAQNGANFVVPKPLNADQLLAEVARAVNLMRRDV